MYRPSTLNFATKAASSKIFIGFIGNWCKKTGTNYPDMKPGNEFWNQVRVPGSWDKSLVAVHVTWIFDNDHSIRHSTSDQYYQ